VAAAVRVDDYALWLMLQAARSSVMGRKNRKMMTTSLLLQQLLMTSFTLLSIADCASTVDFSGE